MNASFNNYLASWKVLFFNRGKELFLNKWVFGKITDC